MFKTVSRLLINTLAPLLPLTAAWAAPATSRPAAFGQLMACRTIVETSQRLACYDREAAALDDAERDRKVIVIDKTQVQAARRSLFGLALPSLGIFGDEPTLATGESRGEAQQQIESVIASVHKTALGKWILVLEDGARWVQIDTRTLSADPRAGQGIRIRRAAMASYLANINGQIAIRVRREN